VVLHGHSEKKDYTKYWYYEELVMSSRNTSVSLGDHFLSFMQAQVRDGRYNSASDVVRAGLRLLEERETKLTMLRQALIAGEESGVTEAFDFESFIADRRAAALIGK
jgi:antitoxin ParD1/3/4